jgi:L-2-hydroxyglutarate oxidase
MSSVKVYDVTIIGAGIVGLATAYQLKQKHPLLHVCVIEKEARVASHQTGHNSGVIHSGLYYKPNSLKATLCVKGRKQLIEFARNHNVKHEICGKLVVATNPEEEERIDFLYKRGQENGLNGLEIFSQTKIRDREPYAGGKLAILVPEEGIIDFVGVCKALERELSLSNVDIFLSTRVIKISSSDSKMDLVTNTGVIRSRKLISCAGLQSDRMFEATGKKSDIRIIPFRGEYYNLNPKGQGLVKHLIYPVPNPKFPFLGVHFTRMVNGNIECGPNAVLAFSREQYEKFSFSARDTIDTLTHKGFLKFAIRNIQYGLGEQLRSLSKAAFVASLQKLLPAIRSEHLDPGTCGIRAQAMSKQGVLLDDFFYVHSDNALFVLNAPSPAATASFAIGEKIVDYFQETVL